MALFGGKLRKEATVYKNAWGLRKISDERDEEADKEYWRRNRAAAGIEPKASDGFISGTKLAVLLGGGHNRGYVRLAIAMNTYIRINKRRAFNALGRPWTHEQVKVFVERFLP